MPSLVTSLRTQVSDSFFLNISTLKLRVYSTWTGRTELNGETVGLRLEEMVHFSMIEVVATILVVGLLVPKGWGEYQENSWISPPYSLEVTVGFTVFLNPTTFTTTLLGTVWREVVEEATVELPPVSSVDIVWQFVPHVISWLVEISLVIFISLNDHGCAIHNIYPVQHWALMQ